MAAVAARTAWMAQLSGLLAILIDFLSRSFELYALPARAGGE